MAQTSTSILSSKSHIADVTGTDISFNATGSTYKITSTSTSLNGFAVRDLITVSGTTNNNSTFTVKEVTDANNLVVEEIVTTKTADDSTTITLDHTGFVSDKQKGDGYYSQPDGVHTVAYQIINLGDSTDDFNGTVKMQGTLATTPVEADWFTVDTNTLSTQTTSAIRNVTGNYVWIRIVVTYTDGTVNGVVLNH